eukprot:6580643-Prymnesium_polylepis.1
MRSRYLEVMLLERPLKTPNSSHSPPSPRATSCRKRSSSTAARRRMQRARRSVRTGKLAPWF